MSVLSNGFWSRMTLHFFDINTTNKERLEINKNIIDWFKNEPSYSGVHFSKVKWSLIKIPKLIEKQIELLKTDNQRYSLQFIFDELEETIKTTNHVADTFVIACRTFQMYFDFLTIATKMDVSTIKNIKINLEFKNNHLEMSEIVKNFVQMSINMDCDIALVDYDDKIIKTNDDVYNKLEGDTRIEEIYSTIVYKRTIRLIDAINNYFTFENDLDEAINRVVALIRNYIFKSCKNESLFSALFSLTALVRSLVLKDEKLNQFNTLLEYSKFKIPPIDDFSNLITMKISFNFILKISKLQTALELLKQD